MFNRSFGLYPDQKAIGEVAIDKENILNPAADLRRSRTRIGMIFQTANPFPLSTVENIETVQYVGGPHAARRYGRRPPPLGDRCSILALSIQS